MKATRLLAMSCVLASWGVSAQTAPLQEKWCRNISFTWWTNSSHPGGNGNGKLNENNGGFGFKCFLQKEHPYFFHFDVLENSQYGNTLSAGFGKQIDLMKIGPFGAYAGGALSLTYYEVTRRTELGPGYFEQRNLGAVVVPFMPSVHVGVSYDLPRNWGTISFQQNQLLAGIRLRSLGWQYKF